jgi:predicted alpha/beta superfamily hydrolase
MRSTLACLALISVLSVMWAPAARADSGPPCRSTATGDLRLHTLKSAIFGNERTIRVLLPDRYDDPANRDRRYPVLYMLDGQNVFDACLSDVSRREWGVDETVRQLVAAGRIPPMIIVGVDHAGAARGHEYLPYKDFVGNPDMPEPAGRQFPEFMAKEVMPLVDGRYRTLTGHANTGIGGSSYGGIASLYALLARPNTFGYALIESPVLWIGMGQVVRDTRPLIAMPRKVFMGFGGREIGDPNVSRRVIGLVREVEANFRAAGYDDTNVQVVIDPEAEHNEPAWAKRLPGALTFLFGDWKPTPASPPTREGSGS